MYVFYTRQYFSSFFSSSSSSFVIYYLFFVDSYTHRGKSHRSFNVEDVSFSIYMHERYKYPLFEHMRTILKMNTFERTIDLVKFFTGIKMEEKRLEGVGEKGWEHNEIRNRENSGRHSDR